MSQRMVLPLFIAICIVSSGPVQAELPPSLKRLGPNMTQRDETVREFVTPSKILWRSGTEADDVPPGSERAVIKNEAVLLQSGTRQPTTVNRNLCTMRSAEGENASLLFDFGIELHGGLQLVLGMSPSKDPVRFRVRFGESVTEAMSDIGGETFATNDHAMRDLEVSAPWLGSVEVGNTGFRFVRIDLLDTDRDVLLKEVNAVFSYRDIPDLGSFRCNDQRLNEIWQTGAYTVHLNMQHYLWDGIKRDRLVWIGDMHPETMTICSVFGDNEVVPKSLDYARDNFPLPGWMNGLSSYSMWWVIIHQEWYQYQGNREYLQEQREYMIPLLKQLMTKIDEQDREQLDGRFLDWPSSENKPAIHAGLQALMVMTMDAGAEICDTLNEPATAAECRLSAQRLRRYVPDPNNSKQAAALLAISGLAPVAEMNEKYLAVDGSRRMSTFYGYYIIDAMARADNHQGAIDCIRDYWGGMLDLGATTFWEDFNIEEMEGAGRIDQFVPEGKKDIHADFGNYCYQGLRHSLCHGWASGPTAWMTEHLLGIEVLEPGCRKIKITPHLADLQWIEGSFPTPQGVVTVRHEKRADGSIATKYTAPKGVEVLLGE